MEDDLPLVHKFEPFTHQPIEHVPKKKQNKIKSFFAWIWKQIKGHKIIVAVIVVIIAIIIALFIFMPVVAIGPMKYVNEDTTVRLELNQTAKLKYSNVTLKINQFIPNVCPVGKCFGSGPIVDYDLYVNDQLFYFTSGQPFVKVSKYQVKTIKTDNKTYAEVKIVKS